MPYENWDRFWWQHITGAHIIVNRVISALLGDKMVILQVPADLPWRHTMRDYIQAAFKEQASNPNIYFQPIDVKDHNIEGMAPGRFILQSFAPANIRSGYREKSKSSIQEYISANKVLNNQIPWVYGLKGDDVKEWVEFCTGFSAPSVSNGLFVLEIQERIENPDPELFEYINYNDNVSNYDLQLFNSFILDAEGALNATWKKYISTLVAVLCDVDAEISELLLRSFDPRTESPLAGLERIVQNEEFVQRGAEPDSNHVLWYFRNGDMLELDRRIWNAQIQVLFPIIEMERIELIRKWEDQISDFLKNNDGVPQYGVLVKEPMDVELGTLCYMMNCRNRDAQRMLYIPDDADKERIQFLHTCRNQLAHVTCCTPEEVTLLIEKK